MYNNVDLLRVTSTGYNFLYSSVLKHFNLIICPSINYVCVYIYIVNAVRLTINLTVSTYFEKVSRN